VIVPQAGSRVARSPCIFSGGKAILILANALSGRKPTFLLVVSLVGVLPRRIRKRRGLQRVLAMQVDVEKITEMARRVAVSEGLALVDVELKGGGGTRLLRVYIDKPGGVSHADCELVSEQLSAMLDVEDPFPGRYTLEVSSPGLDRELVKPSEFEHFAGRKARVVVREPVDDQKVLEGRLAGFEAGRVRLDLGDAGLKELELSNIQKARLVVEI